MGTAQQPTRRGTGGLRALALRTIIVAASTLCSPPPASAEEPNDQSPQFGWRETWGGADISGDVWLLYSGVTVAPFSRDIYSEGLRLRLSGGYGQYSYGQTAFNCAAMAGAGNVCQSYNRRVDVNHTYVDALVGYHLRLGELTAKAFGGISIVDHRLARGSFDSRVRGLEVGATGALEFWLNVGDAGWASLDLQFTTAHETAAARSRAGWRVLRSLSVGPEARLDRNVYDLAGRVGLFARYEWAGGEFSVSGGYASSIDGGLSLDPAPYVTANLLSQF